MSTDLAVRDTDSWADVLEPIQRLSTDIAKTEFVPASMRGDKFKVLAAIYRGRELGLPPMTALASLDVIEGKPTLTAAAMRGLIQASGHQIRITESGNLRCTLKARRREDRDDDEAWSSFSYTYQEAVDAGITMAMNKKTGRVGPKHNWQHFRQDMLLARTTTRMARAMFADVIMGLATSELVADDSETVEVIGEEVITPLAGNSTRTVSSPRSRRTTVKSQAPKPDLSLSDINIPTDSDEETGVGEVEPGATAAPSPSPDVTDETESIVDAEIVDEQPAQPVEMITAAQLKKLHVTLTEAGMGGVGDRAQAIQLYQDVTGCSTITSSKQLTKTMAMKIIDALEGIIIIQNDQKEAQK